jgi:hypothetical protein
VILVQRQNVQDKKANILAHDFTLYEPCKKHLVIKLSATHTFGRIFWTVYTGFVWKSTHITLHIDKIKNQWTKQDRKNIFLAFPLMITWDSPKHITCLPPFICSVTETVDL